MNMQNLKCSAIVMMLCALLVGTFPADVFAQQVTREQLQVEVLNDFILEPTKNEVLVDPGTSAIRRLAVTNRTERTVTFTIDIEDIVGSDDPSSQVKLLGDERGPYSLRDFLYPAVREFTLRTGERITIPITVAVPEDIEPRGYYGAIIVSAKDQETEGTNSVEVGGVTKLVTRVGSLFLVRVNGEVTEESSLEVFKPTGPWTPLYTKHPSAFEIGVKNTGNVHLVHYGAITIKNILGKEVQQLPVNAFFTLPDAMRYREIQWPDSFAFGRYTAELTLYKGFDDPETNAHVQKVAFWVIPWNIVIPTILVLVVIVLLVRFFKKNFKIERTAK